MTSTCLITGATGALGPSVVEAFLRAGYRVRVLARRPPDEGLFAGDVERVTGDILDPSALREAVRGVDTVVHLAALLHVTNPPPSLQGEYERVNRQGTELLVRECEEQGVSRIVYCSTIAVYGYGGDAVLSETMRPEPDTWYGRSKLEAESIILGARDVEGKPSGTVLRLAAVYGSRLKGNYLRLVHSLRRGRYLPIGRGSNHRALIYDKDVAQAVLLAATHPSAPGEVFNVSDGASPTLNEIVEDICAALGRRKPAVFLPAAPVRLGVRLLHGAAGLLGIALPITPATLDKYFEDVRVDSSRIRERLGFQPAFDQRSGWKDALSRMQF